MTLTMTQMTFAGITALANSTPEPTFKPNQRQLRAVYDVMKTGAWFTLWEIAEFAKLPPTAIPAVSARIRDLDNLHGIRHEKRKGKDAGLYEYRLVRRVQAVAD